MVVVNSLSEENTQKTVEMIRAQGAAGIGCAGDVSQETAANTVIQAALSRWGKINILINNAGIVSSGNVEQTSIEEWERSMDINIRSVFLMSRLALPYLRDTGGVIVNNASVVALKGVRNRAAYSASKGAVVALSRAMAADYIKEHVRVNCVCPGTTHTPSLDQRIADSPNPERAFEEFVARQPMGRLGDPADIADAILFAADNPFLTGTVMAVDGGMLGAC